MLGGVHPLVAIPLAAVIAAVISVPVAALMFRLRGHYFAIGTWVVAEVFRLLAAQTSALDGGSGTSLPAAVILSIASSRQMREFVIYWIALAQVVGDPRCDRVAVALALWTRADRNSRQRVGRAQQRRRCRAHQIHRLCRRGFRHGDGRRADLPAENSHFARHGVFGERLDRLRHLHHGDWRHRPDRRADHRHRGVLRPQADAGRSRRDLSSDPRRGCHRGHAEGAQRPVGPDRRPFWLAGVPTGAAAGDRENDDAANRRHLHSAGASEYFGLKQRKFAHDPDSLHDPAGAAPPRRARRPFARPFQLRGAGRGPGREVLWPVRAQHQGRGRQARALHPRPSAPLGRGLRRAAQEVHLRLIRRLRGRSVALPRAAGEAAHRPARSAEGLRVERPVVPRSGRHAGRNPRRREKLAQREGHLRDEGRRCRPPERAEPQQGAHRCSRGGWPMFLFSSPTSPAPSSSTATCWACGCRIAPAISSPSCTASTAATIT